MQWHTKFKKKGKVQPKFYVDILNIGFTDTHVKIECIADSKHKNRAKENWIKMIDKCLYRK